MHDEVFQLSRQPRPRAQSEERFLPTFWRTKGTNRPATGSTSGFRNLLLPNLESLEGPGLFVAAGCKNTANSWLPL